MKSGHEVERNGITGTFKEDLKLTKRNWNSLLSLPRSLQLPWCKRSIAESGVFHLRAKIVLIPGVEEAEEGDPVRPKSCRLSACLTPIKWTNRSTALYFSCNNTWPYSYLPSINLATPLLPFLEISPVANPSLEP